MNKIFKHFDWCLSLVFGIMIFVFFAFFYRYHLLYQEQLQLFLFTSYYLSDLMGRPGGLADYFGTFFTQFYYYPLAGALCIASFLVLLQLVVKRLCNKWGVDSPVVLPFSFVPSILMWALLCDENYLLTALLAILLTMIPSLLYLKIKSSSIRLIFVVLMFPLLYWFAGGVFWIFGILCILSEWFYFKQLSKLTWGVLLIVIVGSVMFYPLISGLFLQYPESQLWWGIGYNRYPVVLPYSILVVWVSIALVPLCFVLMRNRLSKLKYPRFTVVVSIVLVSVFALFALKLVIDWRKEEVMAYDYYTRVKNWKKIIDMANRKDPDTPLSVTCLNLALYKDGAMGNSMFRYFQNGPEGLLPAFQRDFTSPLIAGEVYYHLGFLNTSMRYSFEAMEALPDYKKSSRAMLRIAEVNLLNGENKVAEKYLRILQHTLFYDEEATRMLECLGDDRKIKGREEWIHLQKIRMKSDFLFSENEKDQMLGLLFVNNQSNKMAFEYLMAYTLLIKDLDHFVQYFPLGKKLGYREIPAHYQEALLFYWINTGHDINDLPWSIDSPVIQNYINFSKALAAGANANSLYRGFSQTYWYYLQFSGGDRVDYTQKPIY